MKQYDFVKDPEKKGDEAITVSHSPKRRLDIGARLLCFLIAVGVWIYISNIHDTGTQEILTLKIEVVGAEELIDNDNMMIYDMSKKTVNITVKGTNRDLKKYSDSDYKATVDASKITNVGEQILTVSVKVPENSSIEFVSSDPPSILLWSDYMMSKDIPVEAVLIGGENQAKYSVAPSVSSLNIQGPKGIVDRIGIVVFEIGGVVMNGQVIEDISVRFYDALHKEIDSKGALTYSTEGMSVIVSEKVPELDASPEEETVSGADESSDIVAK